MKYIKIGEKAIYPNIGIEIHEGYEGTILNFVSHVVINGYPMIQSEHLTIHKQELDIDRMQGLIDRLRRKCLAELNTTI